VTGIGEIRDMNKSNYLLPQSATIFEALEKIDLNSDGIVFICDNDNRIKGIATDGDIRASILNNVSLSDSIEVVMNEKFVWRRDTDSREAILKVLDSQIKVIPILDQDMRLVEVVTPYDFPLKSVNNIFVRAKAPVRISFGGGGSDVTHYFKTNNGAVLNATISLYCHATLKPHNTKNIIIDSLDLDDMARYDNIDDFLSVSDKFDLFRSVIRLIKPSFGFHLSVNSDFPKGSGLGGSSSVIAAVLGCFNELRRDKWSDHEMAEFAFQAERINMKISGGWQDQYATIFGGFNFIEFKNNSNLIFPLRLRKKTTQELQENLVLFSVSSGRNSGIIHDDQKMKMQQKDIKPFVKKNVYHCHKMKEYLLRDELNDFGDGLNLAWKLKRKFSDKISNIHLDDIYSYAIDNGALGGKLLGAGGGGFFLFYVQPFKKNSFLKSMKTKGFEQTNFQFDYLGMQSWTKRLVKYKMSNLDKKS
jgi:D-glycero-alpha-D-manno-heptose-7-phosphate kinase